MKWQSLQGTWQTTTARMSISASGGDRNQFLKLFRRIPDDSRLLVKHKQIVLFLTDDSTTALWYSYGQVLNEPETTRQECPFTSDLSQLTNGIVDGGFISSTDGRHWPLSSAAVACRNGQGLVQ